MDGKVRLNMQLNIFNVSLSSLQQLILIIKATLFTYVIYRIRRSKWLSAYYLRN